MNKERRNKIKEISIELKNINEKLNELLDEENYSFDNMPENLQGSLRGIESEDSIDIMEESIGKIKEIIDDLIII